MNNSQLTSYAQHLCGNDYVSLRKNIHLLEVVINHPDYSHISERNNNYNFYFYCEGSPSGVIQFAVLSDPTEIERAIILSKIDAITNALHN